MKVRTIDTAIAVLDLEFSGAGLQGQLRIVVIVLSDAILGVVANQIALATQGTEHVRESDHGGLRPLTWPPF